MRLVLVLLIFILMGPYFLMSDKSLRSDFAMRSEITTLALIQTTDRECTSSLGVFHQCSFKYEQNGVEQKQKYNMFAFGAPEQLFMLQGRNSGQLTTSTGQEYLWNRIFTVIFGMLVSLLTLLGLVKKLTGSSSPRPAAPQQQTYQPPVPTQQPLMQRRSGGRGQSGFGTRSGFSG